eukprot:262077-Rhodomonas_salina.1
MSNVSLALAARDQGSGPRSRRSARRYAVTVPVQAEGGQPAPDCRFRPLATPVLLQRKTGTSTSKKVRPDSKTNADRFHDRK